MGVRIASSGTLSSFTATYPGNASTLASTTGLIGLVQDNAQVIIQWYYAFTIGAGVTAMALKLLRGALLASPIVNQAVAVTVTAGNTAIFSGTYVDTPGIVGQVQYSMLINPTGAAANSTILDSCLLAYVL